MLVDRDAPRTDRAHRAAHHDAAQDQADVAGMHARHPQRGQGRDRGDRHAEHGEQVAVARARRVAQELEADDEQHGSQQVGEVEGGRKREAVHGALDRRLLLEQLEHPVGDHEAAEQVHRPSTTRGNRASRAAASRRSPAP